MANIFKKIRSIDEVDDVPAAPPLTDKGTDKDRALGLKPLLDKLNDEDLAATNNKENDNISNDDELQIPSEKEFEDKKSIPNALKPDIGSDDAPDKTAEKNIQTSDKKSDLNIRPADVDENNETKMGALIKSIDVDPKEPTRLNIEPDLSAEKMPSILSETPVPPLKLPTFHAPKWPYWILTFIVFMWIIGSAAAAYGYFELGLNSLTANPIHALGFVGFIFVPACLLLMTALMLRRMNQLSFESQKMAFINEQLLTPSDYSQKAAANLSKSITGQMDRIEQRAEQAIHRIQQLQSALDQQITSVTQTLSQNAEQQTTLDTQLINSKSAWAQTVKDTDQTITELSQSLDTVLQSFQTRVETSQQQFDLVKSSMLEYSQNLDTALSAQDSKVKSISEQQEKVKQSADELRDKWENDDETFQERIFNQLSQIDAIGEQVDGLVKKLERSTEQIKTAAAQPSNLPLRGTMQDDQLSLIPGLGEAKALLPTLLETEVSEDQSLDFEDVKTLDIEEVLYSVPDPSQQTLSSQRINVEPENTPKKKWFKSFGRRQDSPNPRAETNHHDISTPPVNLQQQTTAPPPPQRTRAYVPLTLTERLIREQLSPDVLIDSGCAREAARLHIHEGPFAMSRYVSTHLGAAVVHLRELLPNNPALRTQVNDMAAVFPMRERLDTRNEESLAYIFSSQAGREYLLCEAVVNGGF